MSARTRGAIAAPNPPLPIYLLPYACAEAINADLAEGAQTLGAAGSVRAVIVRPTLNVRINAIQICCADVVAGNVRVGIYNCSQVNPFTPDTYSLLVESASTPLVGTDRTQDIPIAETLLAKGVYYWFCVQLSDATTKLWRSGQPVWQTWDYALWWPNAGAYGPFQNPLGAGVSSPSAEAYSMKGVITIVNW